MSWENHVPQSVFYRLWLEGIGWELAEFQHCMETAKTDADRKRYAALVEMTNRAGRNVATLSRFEEQEVE